MPIQSQAKPVEEFRPVAKAGVESFPLPDGHQGLYLKPLGEYIHCHRDLAALLPAMDGSRTLCDLVVESATQGKSISIQGLMRLIGQLGRLGFLVNSRADLASSGLDLREDRGLLPRLRATGHIAFMSRTLGKAVERVFSVFLQIPSGLGVWLGLMWLSIVLLTLASLIGMGSKLTEDPLWYEGRYSLGLLLVYAGAVLALSMRELFRTWILIYERVGVYAAGVVLRGLVISPGVDDRHLFRTGPSSEILLRLGGLSGSLLVMSVLLFLSALGLRDPLSQGLSLAFFGAGLTLYGQLCPFVKSDLGRIIDLFFPEGLGRRKSLTYFWRRMWRRLGSRHTFQGETQYIVVVMAMIGWIYGGVLLSSFVLQSLLESLTRLPGRDVDQWELLCLIAVIACVGFVMLSSLVALIFAALGGLVSPVFTRRARPMQVLNDAARAEAALRRSALFVHMEPALLTRMAERARTEIYQPGQKVLLQGPRSERLYLVDEGHAALLEVDESGLEKTTATLGPGDTHGETALFSGDEVDRRSAALKALTELRLVAIERQDFAQALAQVNIPRDQVLGLLRSTHALRVSPVFCGMTSAALAQIVGKSVRESHPSGARIISEGEAGGKFYFIQSGRVVIQKSGEDQPLATLGPGEYFGEIALLTDSPRTTSASCVEACTLLALDKDSFRGVMSRDFAAFVEMERAAERRIFEARGS